MILSGNINNACIEYRVISNLFYMFNQKKDEVGISNTFKQRQMYRKYSSLIDILGSFGYSLITEILFTLNFSKDIPINLLHIMKVACS